MFSVFVICIVLLGYVKLLPIYCLLIAWCILAEARFRFWTMPLHQMDSQPRKQLSTWTSAPRKIYSIASVSFPTGNQYTLPLITMMGKVNSYSSIHLMYLLAFPAHTISGMSIRAEALFVDACLTIRIFPHSGEESETSQVKESNMILSKGYWC